MASGRPLFAVVLLLQACANNKYLAEEYETALTRADAFDPSTVLESEVVELQSVPLALPEVILARAEEVVNQEPELDSAPLQLSEVRRYALENNLGIEVDLFDPKIAEQSYLAEKAKFEAILTAQVRQTKNWDMNDEVIESTFAEPSIVIPIPTGAVLSVGVPFSETRMPASENMAEMAGINKTAQLGVSLVQPVLRNAGPQVNLASIETAGLLMRQTNSLTKLRVISTLAGAERAYWRYYAAYQLLQVRYRQYELALEQRSVAERMVAEGVRTRVELTRAESGVALQFSGVIVAETSRRRAERALKRFINIPNLDVDTEATILPMTPTAPQGMNFDRGRLVSMAYSNRQELLQNEMQLEIDRITIDVDRNQTLPKLDVTFQYAYSGAAPESKAVWEMMFDRELNGLAAGVSFEMPLLGNRSAKAKLRQSLLQRSQTLATRRLLEQAVREEVHNAADAVEQSWQQILSNRLAIALAEKTYEEEKQQFALGVRTSTDVLISLNSLSDARVTQIGAFLAYQNAMIDLAFATGTVMGSGDISWADNE